MFKNYSITSHLREGIYVYNSLHELPLNINRTTFLVRCITALPQLVLNVTSQNKYRVTVPTQFGRDQPPPPPIDEGSLVTEK